MHTVTVTQPFIIRRQPSYLDKVSKTVSGSGITIIWNKRKLTFPVSESVTEVLWQKDKIKQLYMLQAQVG